MLWIQIVLLVIFVLSLLAVFYIYYYNVFQNSVIRINAVESDIDELLRTKFELLSRAMGIAGEKIKLKDNIMDDIAKLKEKDITSFDFDQKLADGLNEFYKIREVYPEVKEIDAFLEINHKLEDIEEQIIACRSYYNDNITIYNELVKKFPSNLIGKILKFKDKPFFDGKDMYDSIYNDFKL